MYAVDAASEGRLATNANDVNALYARESHGACGQPMGMAEHAWIAAPQCDRGTTRRRACSDRPNYVDAKTCWASIYISSEADRPAKVAASVVGTRQQAKGLEYLREVAPWHPKWRTPRRPGAVLRREQAYAEALQLVGGMYQAFPRNFLVAPSMPTC